MLIDMSRIHWTWLMRDNDIYLLLTIVEFLNVNRTVTALASGASNPSSDSDYLFIGMATDIMSYDVPKNHDNFYREVPDGANAIAYGQLGDLRLPSIVVGGNCSIQVRNSSFSLFLFYFIFSFVCRVC